MNRALSVGAQDSVPRVDDIVSIARNNIVCALDEKNLARIKKESPAPKNFVPCQSNASENAASVDRLSNYVSRAGIYCVLLRLVYGSSGCRPAVLQALEGLLREGGTELTLPRAECDSDALAGLTASLCGIGSALGLSDSAFSRAMVGADPPGLSKNERLQLLSGSPVTCGALSIAVTYVRDMLHIGSLSFAMSCEALKASTAAFADSQLPNVLAGKYVAEVARDVVALLEGSSLANAKSKDGGTGNLKINVKVVASTVLPILMRSVHSLNIYHQRRSSAA